MARSMQSTRARTASEKANDERNRPENIESPNRLTRHGAGSCLIFEEDDVPNIRYVVLTLCCCAGISSAEDLSYATPKEVGLSVEKLGKIGPLIEAAINKNQTPGVVILIARHGKVAHVESYGKIAADTRNIMPPDAIFRIYSMTKPITTVAALILHEEGKLKLDDPVSHYLPELKVLRVHAGKGNDTVPTRREMTIRDLMRHTSGFTYGMPNGSPVDKLYIASKVEDPAGSLDQARQAAAAVSARHDVPLQRLDRRPRPGDRGRFRQAAGRVPDPAHFSAAQDAGHRFPRPGRQTAPVRIESLGRWEGQTASKRCSSEKPIPPTAKVPVRGRRAGFDGRRLCAFLPDAVERRRTRGNARASPGDGP
jgi:hypothetical protein